MPNALRSIPKQLQALIAEIEADAYARGRADAQQGLLQALAAGGGNLSSPKISRGRRAKQVEPGNRPPGGRQRAPRGSVPRFVERVLRDHPSSTVQEILERTATDMERSIKLPSIRNELQSGRKKGKYESNGRLWSLAAPGPGATETAEATPSDAPPAPVRTRGTLGLFS